MCGMALAFLNSVLVENPVRYAGFLRSNTAVLRYSLAAIVLTLLAVHGVSTYVQQQPVGVVLTSEQLHVLMHDPGEGAYQIGEDVTAPLPPWPGVGCTLDELVWALTTAPEVRFLMSRSALAPLLSFGSRLLAREK